MGIVDRQIQAIYNKTLLHKNPLTLQQMDESSLEFTGNSEERQSCSRGTVMAGEGVGISLTKIAN